MPTGFEKFKSKALKEEPISIVRKSEDVRQAEENPFEQMRRSADSRRAREEAPAAEPGRVQEKPQARESGRKRSGAELNGLVTVTVQLREETKAKLDEMKFYQKRKLWELVDEAVSDLYKKYR